MTRIRKTAQRAIVTGACMFGALASPLHAQVAPPAGLRTGSQADTLRQRRTGLPEPSVAGAALILGVSAALDQPMRSLLCHRGSGPAINSLSTLGNALGTASHLVPAMAGSYIIARIAGSNGIANDILDAAAGYAAADISEGLLKTAVGRERPIVHGDPGRFHPFTNRGDYHSFPSGHLTHISSIAAAAAIESNRPWVRDAGIAAMVLVGWQRIHADQHWTSDVLGGAMLGDVASSAVVRRLERMRGIR